MDREKRKLSKESINEIKKKRLSQDQSQDQSQGLKKGIKSKFPPPPRLKKSELEESGPSSEKIEEPELEYQEVEADLEEIAQEPVITDTCGDLAELGFDIWGSFAKYPVEPLAEKRRERISKPFARCAVKYGFAKFLKDELLLLIYLGIEIVERIPKKTKPKPEEKTEEKKEEIKS